MLEDTFRSAQHLSQRGTYLLEARLLTLINLELWCASQKSMVMESPFKLTAVNPGASCIQVSSPFSKR